MKITSLTASERNKDRGLRKEIKNKSHRFKHTNFLQGHW